MTLTEVMVAVAIVALVSLVMATGFLSATAYIRRGIDLQRAGQIASGYVESQDGANGVAEDGSVTYSGGDVSGSFSGRYITYSSGQINDLSVDYTVFEYK